MLTETEKKCLDLLNSICKQRDNKFVWVERHLNREICSSIEASCRLIEEIEDLRQQISDDIEVLIGGPCYRNMVQDILGKYIIKKPDPLALALQEEYPVTFNDGDVAASRVRSALEKHGLKIVSINA